MIADALPTATIERAQNNLRSAIDCLRENAPIPVQMRQEILQEIQSLRSFADELVADGKDMSILKPVEYQKYWSQVRALEKQTAQFQSRVRQLSEYHANQALIAHPPLFVPTAEPDLDFDPEIYEVVTPPS